ncbi:MAG: transcriptional regulator, partial [Deltaproteobacteria bacterium]|nr:transcriptional regulator [Deltaproteobacteria bacterium]
EVIHRDAPPEQYRNPFLARAMVNLNMIDTIGSGIKKMFQLQRKRNFPLPDYDLINPDKVIVKIQGKILDENYTRLLIEHTDLDLATVILLDKVQKQIRISRDEHRFLKSKNLIEGRYPNLLVSSKIASATAEKSKYIKYRGLDDTYYQKLVISFIKQYGQASRRDIDELLLDKLPDVLTLQQKKNKINRLLSHKMSKELNLIKNVGSTKFSSWILVRKAGSK